MGSAPQTPVYDPAGVSAGQFEANLAGGESAQAGSQVNQIGPTGSLTYYQTGVGPNGVPTYSAVQQLTPQQQGLLNEQQLGMGLQGGAGTNMLASTFNQYSQPTDLSAAAGGLTSQLLGQETSYLNPFFKQQQEALTSQEANQGIDPSSPAAVNAQQQLSANQNQAVTGFLAQAEPQAFSQAQQNYLMPLQVGQQLLGGNVPGNVGLPETGAAPGYAAPNVQGAVNTAETTMQSNTQLQAQQQQALLTGALGIGKSLLGMF